MTRTKATRKKERTKSARLRAANALALPGTPAAQGQKPAPSARWAKIHDRHQAADRAALATHRGDILSPTRAAKRALTPELRARPHTVEANGQGIAARRLYDALDTYHQRGHLATDAKQNDRRYRAGVWLRNLWAFVHTSSIKTVRWEDTAGGGGDRETHLQQKIDAHQKLSKTWERLRDHHPVLRRVLIEGQAVEKTGANSGRLTPLRQALDAVDKAVR